MSLQLYFPDDIIPSLMESDRVLTTRLAAVVITLIISLLFAPQAKAQQSHETTITEPGRMTLDDLFKRADTVAVVRILSGDTENYPVAVYKAEVLKSFKGVGTGKTIYLGPFIGQRLGWE
jgi:hypothetical protein